MPQQFYSDQAVSLTCMNQILCLSTESELFNYINVPLSFLHLNSTQRGVSALTVEPPPHPYGVVMGQGTTCAMPAACITR